MWLTMTVLLVVTAHMRWGVGLLGWFVVVPPLRYLRTREGWKPRAWLVVTLVLAWTATTLKIATAPLSPSFAVPVGLLLGAEQAIGYLSWDAIRRRVREPLGALVFAALMTTIEWGQHHYTPLASWGAAAYTQLDNLPLLQIASVLGMAAVSFLIYWGGALMETALTHYLDGSSQSASSLNRRSGVAFAAVLMLAVGFGTARLNATNAKPTVRAAAIGTIGTFTGLDNAPDAAGRQAIVRALLDDTGRAADAGARLIVWTEAAALVLPEEEQTLISDVQRVTRQYRAHVVAAFLLLRSRSPLVLENKYVWIGDDGAVLQTYLKHHPAPGEPIVVGTGPLTALDTRFGRLSGAICYDYDYPALAAEHGRMNVDIVALPSSDWRGIDPIHTEMAALRAVEQGVSIVRSTRFGLSAGIDPHGVLRARRSSFETDERVLLVELPEHGQRTVYRRVGDVFVLACVVFLLVMLSAAPRSKAFRTTP